MSDEKKSNGWGKRPGGFFVTVKYDDGNIRSYDNLREVNTIYDKISGALAFLRIWWNEERQSVTNSSIKDVRISRRTINLSKVIWYEINEIQS